jgi:hypothetical protein
MTDTWNTQFPPGHGRSTADSGHNWGQGRLANTWSADVRKRDVATVDESDTSRDSRHSLRLQEL